MEGKERCARFPVFREPPKTDRHSLMKQLKGALREARPYAIGAVTGGVAIMGTDIVNPALARNKEEVILSVFALGAKGFDALKAARRTARSGILAESLETDNISRRTQRFIASSGSFEQKTSLLYNPGVTEQALEILRHDPEFKMRTILNIEEASSELCRLKDKIDSHPRDTQYVEMADTIKEILRRYEHTIHTLAANHGAVPKDAVAS